MTDIFFMASYPAEAKNKSVISFSLVEAFWFFDFFTLANAAKHLDSWNRLVEGLQALGE